MTEIETCENIIEELIPEISDLDKAEIIEQAADIIAESNDSELTMKGLVRTICGVQTLMKVLDTSQISLHQKSVIFDRPGE